MLSYNWVPCTSRKLYEKLTSCTYYYVSRYLSGLVYISEQVVLIRHPVIYNYQYWKAEEFVNDNDQNDDIARISILIMVFIYISCYEFTTNSGINNWLKYIRSK